MTGELSRFIADVIDALGGQRQEGIAMSFVVLGVQPGRIEEMVRSRVRRQEAKLKRCPKPGSTERRTEKARA
ncbi:hypothetical protein FOZ76_10795, partial [Verticiella sediminum]